MGKTKIEYANYAANPYLGCKHGCSYCYGKRMNERFKSKFVKKWEDPEYQINWDYHQLEPIPKPSIVFIGSMTDLMGEWLDDIDIRNIIYTVSLYPEHKFLWLTKNPYRYRDFTFPDNCWLGMTLTGAESMKERLKILSFRGLKNKKFISVEPLLGNNIPVGIIYADWFIIGGLTPKPVHKNEWIKEMLDFAKMIHTPVFIKSNAQYPEKIQEYPKELKL